MDILCNLLDDASRFVLFYTTLHVYAILSLKNPLKKELDLQDKVLDTKLIKSP